MFVPLVTFGACFVLAGCIFGFAWYLGRPGPGQRRAPKWADTAPLPPTRPRLVPDLPRKPGAEATQEMRVLAELRPVCDSETTLRIPFARLPQVTWTGPHDGAAVDPTALPTVAHTRLMAIAGDGEAGT